MDRLFDDDFENLGHDPAAESFDELDASFDQYVAQGIELLEDWMRDPYW